MAGRWTAKNIEDQTGRVVIVTGGNSGIGYEAGLTLAAKNAEVILAVRNLEKGEHAVQAILKKYPSANIKAMTLNLADLKSARSFAETFLTSHDRLDILINNGGIMAIPYRRTVDGFEMQFGTNHLGHFALTGLLMPKLKSTPGARVITVSSSVHNTGDIYFDDLQWEKSYDRWGAYAQSKLSNLLFAYELQRHLTHAGLNVISVGCHPGYAATNLQAVGPLMDKSIISYWFMQAGNFVFAQNQRMGALPTLFAAVASQVNGCDYIGPTSFFGMRGYPGKVKSSNRSYNEALANRLWTASEKLTGVVYDF